MKLNNKHFGVWATSKSYARGACTPNYREDPAHNNGQLGLYGIRKKLEPFLVKQLLADDWFGYSWSHLPLDPPADPMEIQIYKANPDTKKFRSITFLKSLCMRI